jgi:hypothetical protein
MTENEWHLAAEPQTMLEFLQSSGRPSERKLRLFAVACSRRIWDLIDDLGRAAVEMAENYADGLVGPDELRAARLACQGAGGQAAWYAAASNPTVAARNAARSAQAGSALIGSESAELLAQAALVREINGRLPFRPLFVEPTWLTPQVVVLAKEIYDDRAFAHLPVLANSLEESGCNMAELLAHCRVAGPHVRGCWAVDLVLEKG